MLGVTDMIYMWLGPLGASMGLWEEQQFRNVPPVVQAETLC